MKKLISIAPFLLFLGTAYQGLCQEDIKGVWLAGEGKTKVEIYQKDSTNYAGKIVWMEEPTNKKGEPYTDKKNTNKALRSRPIMGLHMLENLVQRDGKWYGLLYAPIHGRTMNVTLTRANINELLLEVSYMGFTRTKTWIWAGE